MEDPGGERERAKRAEKLKCLGEGDADFVNRDVIQNVRERDAGHGRDNKDEIYVRGHVKWRADFPENQGQRKQQRGSDEADKAETTDGTEPRGWAFNENAVKRPAEDRDEGDEQTPAGNMSILPVRLKPDHAESAEQSKEGSKLKLPLANDVTFLRKKGEGEERGENDRRPRDDGVNTRSHVKKRDHLGNLVDDVGQTGNQAEPDRADVDPRFAPKLKQDERDDGETGDGVAVKIL